MPMSSTHLFSLTIGNGIPSHVADVAVDIVVSPLVFVSVYVLKEIKKAGSDIQNRLKDCYVHHLIMNELRRAPRYPSVRMFLQSATAAAAP